jgi:hypothetical protein
MTTRLLPHWPYARIVAHGMFTTPFAANVVITEASWRSKKTRPYNLAGQNVFFADK